MSDTKTHILMVSLKLFLQKNFKEVTMKDIVRETGLSKGAFYHYFESKEKLFYEIIDYFFAAILEFDFKQLPNDSLHDFYHANAAQLNTLRFEFLMNENGDSKDFITLNFFALLFDAFKLFPEFRSQMEAYHEKERKAWAAVIKTARSSGEIQSPLSDEQIAQIFLFTSDGLTMNLTMESNTADLDKRLASLWDNFYKTLKP
ncbi:MAG: TetR/AcrR family transcriptional regulator [Bacteroides sp.]|nr:TetR/AcrR family transcriptional regulator [Bacteroides sp.]